MIKFNSEQFAKLSLHAEEVYRQRLEEHLSSFLKRFGYNIVDGSAFKNIVTQSIEQANRYGIDGELETCVFAEIFVTYGPNFLTEYSWATGKIDPESTPQISVSDLCHDASTDDDESHFRWIADAPDCGIARRD